MQGNERFVSGEITNLNIKESIAATSTGQYPQAVVLGHEACGAVKGACDHAQLGNLTVLD